MTHDLFQAKNSFVIPDQRIYKEKAFYHPVLCRTFPWKIPSFTGSDALFLQQHFTGNQEINPSKKQLNNDGKTASMKSNFFFGKQYRVNIMVCQGLRSLPEWKKRNILKINIVFLSTWVWCGSPVVKPRWLTNCKVAQQNLKSHSRLFEIQHTYLRQITTHSTICLRLISLKCLSYSSLKMDHSGPRPLILRTE